MLWKICWNLRSSRFLVKKTSKIFLSFSLKKLITKLLINFSLKTYNYILLKKILRQFGLAKPLKNKKDFKY